MMMMRTKMSVYGGGNVIVKPYFLFGYLIFFVDDFGLFLVMSIDPL